MKQSRIGIIGAGPSGLAAAQALIDPNLPKYIHVIDKKME